MRSCVRCDHASFHFLTDQILHRTGELPQLNLCLSVCVSGARWILVVARFDTASWLLQLSLSASPSAHSELLWSCREKRCLAEAGWRLAGVNGGHNWGSLPTACSVRVSLSVLSPSSMHVPHCGGISTDACRTGTPATSILHSKASTGDVRVTLANTLPRPL